MDDVLVLIAEDEPGIAIAIEAAVRKALVGYKVDIKKASNGQKALEILMASEIPSLCLIDIMMPIVDGIELIKEIRKNNTWTNIPLVVLSTGLGPSENKDCMEAGATAAFSKPPISQLNGLVGDIVDRYLQNSSGSDDDVFGSIFDD